MDESLCKLVKKKVSKEKTSRFTGFGGESLQISKKKKEGKEKLSRFAVLGRESLQNKVFSRLSLHPIHVLVEWVALAFTSRDPVCGKNKVLVKLFQKLVVSKGKAFGRHVTLAAGLGNRLCVA